MTKKILFLVPYPQKKSPSQRFRFEQYFYILSSRNISFTIAPFLTEKAWTLLYTKKKHLVSFSILLGYLKRLLQVLKAGNYDFIFIHREVTPLGPPVFEWFITKVLRKSIIYDFDDAIWLEDPDEKGTLKAWLKCKWKVRKICQWSYKVSAGNRYLGEYASKFSRQVIVNPTTIDTEHHHNPERFRSGLHKMDTPVIGWTGTHTTLQYLNSVIPVLTDLEKKFSFTFLVICNCEPEFVLDSLKYRPWHKESEIEDLMAIDIGLMPLTDDAWAKGKCGFKALQYMALEKPALVSPVGINCSIVEHGITGFHCNTVEDWHKYLSQLLMNPEKCDDMGKKGRRFVKKYYSVEANAANFLSLFDLP